MGTTQKPKNERNIVAHVVPHTHWDREWYLPYEAFRGRLVEVIDTVLSILESDSAFQRFTLDGQTILLEDYLELRPERRPQIRKLVADGRLSIGPWYVLADEFLVSPESLIRNLSIGRDICRKFNASTSVAYTPDSFGHISQLPLIVSGFGLESIVFERGMGDEGEELGAEFLWESRDDSARLFTVHLLQTYSGAAAAGHNDWEYRDTYSTDRARKHIYAVLYGTDEIDLDEMPEWLRESLERIKGGVARYLHSNSVLLPNGSDHLFPQENLPQFIADMNLAFDHVEFRQADMDEFVACARDTSNSLRRFKGEFRGGRYHHVLTGVLSTRMYLKQENHRLESRLERISEPLAAAAWLHSLIEPKFRRSDFDVTTAINRNAARKLLTNHPHDSICGCSVDDVHRQMMCRFSEVDNAIQYSEQRSVDLLTDNTGNSHIVVFNPLSEVTNVPVSIDLEVPEGHGAEIYLRDESGTEIPFESTISRKLEAGRRDSFVEHLLLEFSTPLRPLGFTTIAVERRQSESFYTEAPNLTTERIRVSEDDAGEIHVENSKIAVHFHNTGQVTIRHKKSGKTYSTHPYFEDCADSGDEYDFSPVAHDRALQFRKPREIGIHKAHSLEAIVVSRYEMNLPHRLSESRDQREGSKSCSAEISFSVCVGSNAVSLDISVDNRSEDHRLRIAIPTSISTDNVLIEGHFDQIQRSARPVTPKDEWFQQPQPTNAQRRYAIVKDKDRGLAVANRGLPEYEARVASDGTEILVTLLRCVGWLSRHDLDSRPQSAGPNLRTPDAQCLGSHRFELALVPFGDQTDWRELLTEVDLLDTPPRAFRAGGIAPRFSLFEVEAPLALSIVKRADHSESILIRLWNPTERVINSEIRCGFDVDRVLEVRLDEEPLTDYEHASGTVTASFPPLSVKTFCFVPKPGSNRNEFAGKEKVSIEE